MSGFGTIADGMILEGKSAVQIGKVLSAVGEMIEIYSQSVTEAQQRYEADRKLLAELIAEYSRIAHYIAAIGATALDAHIAQAA